jgi:hypothetical protein
MNELYRLEFPVTPEYQIAAAAAIASFEKMILGRGDKPTFYIKDLPEDARFLLDLMASPLCFDDPNNLEIDVVFQFDVDRAVALASATHKHVTEAFGIMIGVDQPQQFPLIDTHKFEGKWNTSDILIATNGWDGLSDLQSIIDNCIPEAIVTVLPHHTDAQHTLTELLDIAAAHRIVVGHRSALTYLAAALGKHVIEFYSTPEFPDEQFNWLSKHYGNRDYTLLPQRPDNNYSATLIWRLIKQRYGIV